MTPDKATQPARLAQAREYVGFTVEQVAAALDCAPLAIAMLEAGTAAPDETMLERLARLYRRPVTWLQGETTFRPSPNLLRKVENLHPGDREAILDFAEWLQDAGPPPKPARRATDATA